jgi:hypothetical protein
MVKGEYYIGDLCYVLHERWDEVCELLFAGRSDHGCNDGEFELKDGTKFAIYSTAYGDGTYLDQGDNEYWVDSGSIGCILMEDINLNVDGNQIMGGRVVDITHDFTTGSMDGVIKIGPVHIDTDPEDDYE